MMLTRGEVQKGEQEQEDPKARFDRAERNRLWVTLFNAQMLGFYSLSCKIKTMIPNSQGGLGLSWVQGLVNEIVNVNLRAWHRCLIHNLLSSLSQLYPCVLLLEIRQLHSPRSPFLQMCFFSLIIISLHHERRKAKWTQPFVFRCWTLLLLLMSIS